MDGVARGLILIGAGLLVAGLLLAGWTKLGGPSPGRLPGDFSWSQGSVTVYFPLATMILLSLVLTGFVSLFRWWSR